MQFHILEKQIRCPYSMYVERIEPIHRGKPPQCDVCGRAIGLASWLPPLRVAVHASSAGFTDISRSNQVDLLVSERFRKSWIKAGLQGISEFSALESLQLHSPRKPRRKIAYYHIAPEMSTTAIDLEHSSIQYFRPISCAHCKTEVVKKIDRLVIDEKTWTGADIFYPRYLHEFIVVSDRFLEMCETFGIEKVHSTPIDKYVWDPFADFEPSGQIEIIGVHPIVARAPVHLIRFATTNEFETIYWRAFTQANPALERDFWQAAYDEQQLANLSDGRVQAVFFFHYLDITRPLMTPAGPIELPESSPLPPELQHIHYEDPC